MIAPMANDSVALFRRLPELRSSVPWANLGDWPTPVEPLTQLNAHVGGADIWAKREDRSSSVYGGNKVRTLEAIMGAASAAGCDYIWATGAYGSNHALATVLHASRAGLSSGVALFPQPKSGHARANLSAMLSARPDLVDIPNVIGLPFVMSRLRRRGRRRGQKHYVMTPGAAGPVGAFGALSAAVELAEQIEAGECPLPRHLVVATGSACTTAGLLTGIHAAAQLGVGFGHNGAPLPQVVAVSATPWPLTSPRRIAWLAYQTARRLCALTNGRINVPYKALRDSLIVIKDEFGAGYGMVTARGVRAAAAFARANGPPLDIVYSAKAGATLLDLARATHAPLLFWATKSSTPLPRAREVDLEGVPKPLTRWLLD